MFLAAFATRNLPEAFYTPKLVLTRDFGGGGSYEEIIQFAALPQDDGTYMVRKYHRSISIHESGGKPVISLVVAGLSREEAMEMAKGNLAAAEYQAMIRHSDYMDYNRLPVRLRSTRPHENGYCWRLIRPDSQALATPPASSAAHLHS